VPFLLQDTGERVGVFATRSPVRPNYLALSLVRVLAPPWLDQIRN
jgi:tRNA (Thr-GGU) A37 N-methylase